MNRREELLVITMEECAEVSQACSKMLRFNEQVDYENLQDEIGDLMCMVELLKEQGIVTNNQIVKRMKVKREKLKKWSSLINEV
jgi:NTP pyrophosphatase (non-canonical NTP hydrolase)|tara:strand:- start:1032 stop:1283 length:252 start_codon:yes stop_codon:yes gene_type:complete